MMSCVHAALNRRKKNSVKGVERNMNWCSVPLLFGGSDKTKHMQKCYTSHILIYIMHYIRHIHEYIVLSHRRSARQDWWLNLFIFQYGWLIECTFVLHLLPLMCIQWYFKRIHCLVYYCRRGRDGLMPTTNINDEQRRCHVIHSRIRHQIVVIFIFIIVFCSFLIYDQAILATFAYRQRTSQYILPFFNNMVDLVKYFIYDMCTKYLALCARQYDIFIPHCSVLARHICKMRTSYGILNKSNSTFDWPHECCACISSEWNSYQRTYMVLSGVNNEWSQLILHRYTSEKETPINIHDARVSAYNSGTNSEPAAMGKTTTAKANTVVGGSNSSCENGKINNSNNI